MSDNDDLMKIGQKLIQGDYERGENQLLNQSALEKIHECQDISILHKLLDLDESLYLKPEVRRTIFERLIELDDFESLAGYGVTLSLYFSDDPAIDQFYNFILTEVNRQGGLSADANALQTLGRQVQQKIKDLK